MSSANSTSGTELALETAGFVIDLFSEVSEQQEPD